MGFSKSCLEQYKQELRILRRVLAVGALAAAGFHLVYVPAIIRYAGGLMGAVDPAVELDTPIEIMVVDEPSTPEPKEVTPPPPTEDAIANEPAAGAEEPSPLPLASEPVVPEPASADSVDTVATGPAIASETGAEDGQGAAGEADTVGLLPGAGSLEGDPVSPVTPPPTRTRQPVQEVARARAPSVRTITCDPCTQPDYPLAERRDRIEGQPVINVIFDQNGNVVTAELEKSSGNTAFDQAAVEEARRSWRFRDPAGLGGQVSVEVTFVITGSEQHDAAQTAGRQDTVQLPVQQSITPVAPAATGAAPTAPAEAPAVPPPSNREPDSSVDGSDVTETDRVLSSEAEADGTTGPSPLAPDAEDAAGAEVSPALSPEPSSPDAGSNAADSPESAPIEPAGSNSEAPAEDSTNRESAPAIAPPPLPSPPSIVTPQPAIAPEPVLTPVPAGDGTDDE
ncbi:MAG: TonB family protein [Cyanobacteria bacterium J06638_6]